MQDKTPLNDKDQQHGQWERYHHNGNLWYKGEFINGVHNGPWVEYWENGNFYFKGSFINGNFCGLCLWYFKDLSIKESNFYAK